MVSPGSGIGLLPKAGLAKCVELAWWFDPRVKAVVAPVPATDLYRQIRTAPASYRNMLAAQIADERERLFRGAPASVIKLAAPEGELSLFGVDSLDWTMRNMAQHEPGSYGGTGNHATIIRAGGTAKEIAVYDDPAIASMAANAAAEWFQVPMRLEFGAPIRPVVVPVGSILISQYLLKRRRPAAI